MTPNRIALALIAAFIAAPALAAPVAYNIAGVNQTSSAGGTGTSNGTVWNNSSTTKYGTDGTNYGNSYYWANGAGGSGTSLTMTAWGTTAIGGNIAKGWVGDYGSNGFGVTSQAAGELNLAHDPDASSPNYQHAIDNVASYESMMFSFGSAVALNSVSIGFRGSDADATVFVYTGAEDPTASIAGKTYSQLLTSGWTLAGNLFNMSTTGSNAFSSTYSSKYWMVGAFMNLGGNAQAGGNDSIADSFKISGLGVTAALSVPEPDSVALFGIAALGLFLAGRRKARKA